MLTLCFHVSAHILFISQWTPENPEGLEDSRSLNQVIKIKKFLNCPKCGKQLNFLQYYKTHLEWCGRDVCKFHSFCLFSSPEPLGELIVYPWSGVRRRLSTISNFFSSETAWPIKAKFYVEPPWEGGTKVYINDPGHMTKMAAMLKKCSKP